MPEPRFARWDIVKVPFHFTEGIGDKRRPALIVNNKSLATRHKLYWLLMITSAARPIWPGDIDIKDLAAAGLPVNSIVRTAKIATLQEDRIVGRIGHLAAGETRLITAALRNWLEG